MTAFHEVRFPEQISYGAVGGPGFKTTIYTRQSGYEDRNIEWQYARAEYDVSMAIKTQEELDEVREFFYARRGRAYGFRFKDWSDYKSTSVVDSVDVADQFVRPRTAQGPTVTTFPLIKTYMDTGGRYFRPITKPVRGTVRVTTQMEQDGPYMELTEGSGFTVDYATGMVTLQTSTDFGIRAGFEFDVPVRFDTDQMLSTLEDYNVSTWGQIPLIEVR